VTTTYLPRTDYVQKSVNAVAVELRLDDEPTSDGAVLGAVYGDPNGQIVGSPGDARFQIDQAQLWLKFTGIHTTTGWGPIIPAGIPAAIAMLQAQVAQLETDVAALQGAPFIEYGVADPSTPNARVLTTTPTVDISLATPGQVRATVPPNAITNTELADMPATSVKANPTALAADPQDVQALLDNTFFGRQGGLLGFFAVAGAALPQSFVTVSAEASLANERVATTSPTIAVVDNGPGTTVVFNIVVNSVDNTLLADMPANTVKSNPTAAPGDPQDLALGTNTILAREGGNISPLVVGVNEVPLRAGADLTTQAFATNTILLRAGGNLTAFPVGTNTVLGRVAGDIVAAQIVTGQVGDDQITDAKLANMAANTVKANPTAALADPQNLALGTNEVLLRAGGNITNFAVGTNTVLGRVAGDIVAAQVVTGQVGDAQITDVKLANMGARTVKGRASNSSGVPADIAGAGANTICSDDGTSIAFRSGPALGLSLNNVQTFATPGTFSGGSGWQKPTGCTLVLVRVWAAGGGGGGGATTTGAVGRSGGAGGGGGAFKERWFLASELASQETVVVGTGGTFGAGATTDSTDGSPGGIGGNSSFSSSTLGVTAYGGGGGAGGGRSNGSGTSNAGGGGGGTAGPGGVGGGPTGTPVSGTGGTPLYNNTQAAVAGVVGGQGARGATGNGPIPGGFAEYGGGGGGCNNAAATPLVQASGGSIFGGGGGGAGGNVSNDQVTVVTPGAGSASGQWAALGGGSAGTSGAAPTPGGNGAPGTGAQGGQGGGGGGSTATADTNGAIGGNGGARGGGGGGGGAGRNTGDGGNGGRGGHGYVEVYAF
jgi:hypothetical protein